MQDVAIVMEQLDIVIVELLSDLLLLIN